jgi:long-subunit fatty acid transport protein
MTGNEDMKTTTSTLAALLLTTTAATAGGLDRSGQGIGVIFTEGNTIELSYGQVTPSVTGTATGTGLGMQNSGNMASAYNSVSLGVKYQFNEDLSLAVIFDQPFGASVDYGEADAAYYTGPATADVTSSAITAVARYQINSNFSVHGGLRYQTVEASVTKPTAANYAIDSEASSATGYLVGVAYERPEIALRVALTYNSAITHDITATETCAVAAACPGVAVTTSVDTPESFNLDFQSGVAENTLVFGSIRYAKWTQFDFAPPSHAAIGLGSLQSYDNDTVAYSLGVGRKFNDNWSGALTVGYEGETGGFAGNLAPTDGNTSVGLGATYTMDNIEITGGVRYIWLGDADTEHPNPTNVPALVGTTGSEFRDNTATAIGLKVSYNF